MLDDWPKSANTIVDEICISLGITLDSRTELNSSVMVSYPNDLTAREILQRIGTLNGGNFVINFNNQLQLIRPSNASVLTVSDKPFDSLIETGTETISRVTLFVDDDNYYTAGDDSGLEINSRCEWATQAITDSVYAMITRYVNHGYECEGARISPLLEIGDAVTINGLVYQINQLKLEFSGTIIMDLANPVETETESEYPYQGTIQKSLKRKVSLNTDYYGATISKVNGLQIRREDGQSEATFNSDKFEMSSMKDGTMTPAIYFDIVAQKYKLTGDVIVEGSLASDANFTDSLYAEAGDVSQLTVDWLDTSHKISKYLDQDTSDDNYIEIHGQNISFKTASVLIVEAEPQTEQLQNRYGDLLYWSHDISEAEIIGGYPFVGEKQIYTKTDETDWPVIVYQYTTLTKLSIEYDEDGIPEFIICAGDGVTQYSAKGRIRKEENGMEISYYKSNTGDTRSIHMTDAGVWFEGLITLDSLAITDSSFTAIYGPVTVEAEYTTDSSGRINSITTGGKTIPITYA